MSSRGVKGLVQMGVWEGGAESNRKTLTPLFSLPCMQKEGGSFQTGGQI